jgi:sugar phosphate isomerase/epimerase
LGKKKMTRREFVLKTAKGVLGFGCLSLGSHQACTQSERSGAVEGAAVGAVGKDKAIDLARISTCSICLNHLPAEEAFPIIAASGYKKVDVHEKVHLQIFPDLCDIESLKETAARNGLQIANLSTYAGGGLDGRQTAYTFHGWEVPHPERFTSIGFSSDDPEELNTEFEQIKRTIDIAAFVGARSIRVVPGNDEPETLDKVVPWFKRTAEYAAEKNVYMAFENHSAGIAGTPELCVELAEKVGSPYFGVLYEPGNLMFDTGTDYRVALETMKEHIVHCHFKDCKPISEGYEMQHFGQGAIDFPWIVEQLNAAGYEGDFALEYELHHPEAEEGLRKFYEDFLAMFGLND